MNRSPNWYDFRDGAKAIRPCTSLLSLPPPFPSDARTYIAWNSTSGRGFKTPLISVPPFVPSSGSTIHFRFICWSQLDSFCRRILVYFFCLISIGLSLCDEAYKMKFWILKGNGNFSYLWKFEPDKLNSFGEVFLKNLKIYKECMSLLTFCLPVILQFLIAAIIFVTDCKELKLAQAAKINQLASIWYIRLHLLWVNAYANKQKCKQWRHGESDYTYSTTVAIYSEIGRLDHLYL